MEKPRARLTFPQPRGTLRIGIDIGYRLLWDGMVFSELVPVNLEKRVTPEVSTPLDDLVARMNALRHDLSIARKRHCEGVATGRGPLGSAASPCASATPVSPGASRRAVGSVLAFRCRNGHLSSWARHMNGDARHVALAWRQGSSTGASALHRCCAWQRQGRRAAGRSSAPGGAPLKRPLKKRRFAEVFHRSSPEMSEKRLKSSTSLDLSSRI